MFTKQKDIERIPKKVRWYDVSKNVFFIIVRVCLNVRTLFPKSEVFFTMLRISPYGRTPYV